ncbi:MAG: glycosyltransferase family 4 protein [Xanthobacteraceae bacterium]
MKILAVTERLDDIPRNGSEVMCERLLRRLRNSHDVETLACTNSAHSLEKVTFRLDEETRANPRKYADLLASIEVRRYDLVYNLGGLMFGCDAVVELEPWKAGVPLVNHFQALLGPYARAERRPIDLAVQYATSQITAAAYGNCNIFISLAEYQAAVDFGYDLSCGVSCVVPNALPADDFAEIVPSTRFLPYDSRASGSRPIVFMTGGRFSDYAKGADLVYRAFAKLFEQRQDVFLLAVVNSERFTHILRDLPQTSYSIVPWMHRAEFLATMATADVLVVPSRYEPFGLIALESALLSVPVIANAVGGLTDIVLHEQSGFLVPPADGSLGLFAAMRRMAESNERIRMGQRGRERAEREFSLHRVHELIEQSFSRVRLTAKSRRRPTPFS